MGKKSKQKKKEEEKEATPSASLDWMSVLNQKMEEDEQQKSYGKEVLL